MTKKISVAVLAGDGIGKEVMPQALKVITALGKKYGYSFDFRTGLLGLSAYRARGRSFPEDTLKLCKDSMAVFKGPIGDDHDDKAPAGIVEEAVIQIRTALDLYANLRPTKIYPGFEYLSPLKEELATGVDFIVARENVSDIYPDRGRIEPGEQGDFGQDTALYSRAEVHRIAKVAYELARQRNKKVTIVAKKNILASSRAFAQYALEIANNYPEVQTDYQHVDIMTMYLMTKPKSFDVILTTNMFGDILSDQGGGVMGSLGFAWSVNIGEKIVMYECVGGSAPDIAGKNLANPLAMILSCGEIFRYTCKDPVPSDTLHRTVETILHNGWRTRDIARSDTPSQKILGTKEIGDIIVDYLEKIKV